jgi:hypothetical protein
MPPSLQGRAPQADSHKGSRFRHRYGMLNEDWLPQCWRAIRKDAASGVEHVSAQEDAQHRDANIPGRVARLKQQRSRATLVRRPSLPTGEGTQRPRGIPAGAATLLPRAVARLRAALSAQDVLAVLWSALWGGALMPWRHGPSRPCGRDAWGGRRHAVLCHQ